MIRVLGGRGGDEHEWIVTVRQLHLVRGWLPQQRADHVHMRRPRARVLELGERRHERELATRAAMNVAERRKADLFARAVERDPPALEATPDR
ncbi:MAG TPA: hypothetical protein VMU55_06280 [Solirubrobacteraceae bacterium]|nr:hypothetical protein [Solirubrobacteraceae bacterium]